MKNIYSLNTWVLFLIMTIPIILQNTEIGGYLSLIEFTFFIIWFYMLANDLFKKLPGGHSMNIKKFRFHFFFPLTYFLLAIITMGDYTISLSNDTNEYVYFPEGALIVLHLFSFYCIFYCLYFISKALISVFKNNKNPEWTLYIGYLFAFWITPIGIWFIQPKVKDIFKDQQ